MHDKLTSRHRGVCVAPYHCSGNSKTNHLEDGSDGTSIIHSGIDPSSPSPVMLYRMPNMMWYGLLEEMNTVLGGSWIGSIIFESWMWVEWCQHFRERAVFPMRLVRTHMIQPYSQDSPTPHEISLFRSQYGDLPEAGPCPLEDVAYPCLDNGHFFILILMPATREIHILGRQFKPDMVVAEGDGLQNWDVGRVVGLIQELLGWEKIEDWTILNVNWAQNGRDCAAVAGCVLLHIWSTGFEREHVNGAWKCPMVLKGSWQCFHVERKEMARNASKLILQGMVHHPEGRVSWMREILGHLDREITECTLC